MCCDDDVTCDLRTNDDAVEGELLASFIVTKAKYSHESLPLAGFDDVEKLKELRQHLILSDFPHYRACNARPYG